MNKYGHFSPYLLPTMVPCKRILKLFYRSYAFGYVALLLLLSLLSTMYVPRLLKLWLESNSTCGQHLGGLLDSCRIRERNNLAPRKHGHTRPHPTVI